MHPFSYYLDGQDKEGLPYAIGAHNGTISNREEIRVKYKIEAHEVDSAEILDVIISAKENKKNASVFEFYEGFGAFVWTYPGDNKIYIFRGKSDSGEDTSGERPLFYWKKAGQDEIYFSSIKESLLTICDDDEKVIKEFSPNQIHILDNGRMSTLKKVYNRDGKNTIVETRHYSNYMGHNYNSGVSPRPASQIFINFPDKVILNYNKKNCKRDGADAFLEDEPLINVDIMRNLTGNKNVSQKIQYYAGKYWKNGHQLGGKLKEGEILKIDAEGYPFFSTLHNKETAKEYYFWNGWSCNNGECLEKVCDLYKSGEIYQSSNKNYDLSKLRMLFNCIIFNPYVTAGLYRLGSLERVDPLYSFTQFEPLFNQHKMYYFMQGYFKSVVLRIGELKPNLLVLNPPPIKIETADVLNIQDAEVIEEEEDERNLIEGVLIETLDEIDGQMNDLSSLECAPENEDVKIKVLKYLSGAYDYLKEHWTHLTKTEEELKELIY